MRLNKAAFVGGPAEYLFPVAIENPDFGKAINDPASDAIKTKTNGAKLQLAALRRAPNGLAVQKLCADENVIDAKAADTYLTSSTAHWDSRIANFGAEPTLKLGNVPGHNGPARALLKIDLSAFPKDAKPASAQLRLTLVLASFTQSAAAAKLEAYAVRREWNEVQVEGLGASWYGPLYGGNPTHPNPKNVLWAKMGCDDVEKDRLPDVAATADVGNFPRKEKEPKSPAEKRRLIALDLTELVKKWHSGELPNHGVVLIYSGGGAVEIAGSEFQDYPFRPTLVVGY